MKSFEISHIAKIEGHADFLASLGRGEFREFRLMVKEGARLIEGVVLDRKIEEVPIIISRICGICPVVHVLCAIKAMEEALDVKVSKEVEVLRKLMIFSEIIHSHGLHLFFLSLPDFFNLSSDIKLVRKYPKETKDAILVRDFGIKIAKIIGGRTIHPMNPRVGGFRVFPSKKELENLLLDYDKTLEAALRLADLFKKLDYPNFERKTNFVSLFQPRSYGIDDGKVAYNSPKKKEKFSPAVFFKKIRQIEKPSEVIKRTEFRGEIYLTGALARINNNYPFLNPEAKKAWDKAKISLPDFNSFHNIFAQAVEIVHFIEESKKLIQNFSASNSKVYFSPFKMKAGKGMAVVEAPRGSLFHYYQIDKNGIIQNCNIITPTAQFFSNLEEDLKKYSPEVIKKLCRDDCQKKIRALIRAYDPCISCATH